MRSRVALAFAGITCAVLAVAPPVAGQSAHKMTADDIALKNYTLTMDKLEKLRDAMVNMKAYMMAHPEDSTKWADQESNDNESLLEMAARMDKIPPMRAAFRKAGITSRDYMLASMAYFQAAMLAGVQDAQEQAGKKSEIKIPYNMNPANLEFVRKHKADIEALKLGEVMQDKDDSGGS
ncbi:MAG TPA: hypothetical protein VFL95_02000 [Gemmatimonadales bacterium]|nr:hypothetical protein [Gemmatimonadales bacterium]